MARLRSTTSAPRHSTAALVGSGRVQMQIPMKTSDHHCFFSPWASGGKPARNERGFTLIELIIVIAVMAILLAAAVPNFTSFVISNRIKSASFDVYASILAARSAAITRNTTITITPTSGTTNWAAGWSITAGGVTLKTQNAFPGVTMTGPATLVYNSAGRLDAAATPVSLTATNATAQASRCVTIDLSGRPTTAIGVCP